MDLPIFKYKEHIIKTCYENSFVVITGDTGSGKSTQLPQYLIDSQKIREKLTKHKKDLKIVITQPRRMAAISMAKRLCQERNSKLGKEIGYTIRFDDTTSKDTEIRYVTDGILVRECLNDPNLSRYQIVILDEAHERSLYTDILFSLVKKAVKARNGDLQLLVTSATLDCEKFAEFFHSCPIISMEGKCYPVDLKYGPCLSNKRVEESVNSALRMHLHEGPGDILVFLTGSEECEQAAKLCLAKLQEMLAQGRPVPGMVIHSLYGTQQSDEQNQVYQTYGDSVRKLIFSTNIAETSLTLPNIGFVIDCGYVKQKHYNPRTNMDALITVPISKVQAIQRAGRAGRTQPGKCYRLYSESFFKNQMLEYTVPELLRVNLTHTILQLKAMGIDDVMHFGYMEEPDENQLLDGLKSLFLLKAIDEDGKITPLGKMLSQFPLEPSYAKALLSSMLFDCEEDMINLVSLLSTEQIYARVVRSDEESFARFERVQRELMDKKGDHETWLRIYKLWKKNGRKSTFCKSCFLNERALKQTDNIRVQIQELCDQVDYKKIKDIYKGDPIYEQFQVMKKGEFRKKERDDALKMALCSGFFYNSARQMINTPESYIVIHEGTVVNMDPGSIFSLGDQNPTYVVFTELSGTSVARGMMRQVTEIELAWVQPYGELIKKVDVNRLAKKPVKEEKVKVKQEVSQGLGEEEKKRKIEEAKQRYLERKKVKL